jgi:hypothetical protein
MTDENCNFIPLNRVDNHGYISYDTTANDLHVEILCYKFHNFDVAYMAELAYTMYMDTYLSFCIIIITCINIYIFLTALPSESVGLGTAFSVCVRVSSLFNLKLQQFLSPAPAKRSGGYGNAGCPSVSTSEICCKRSKNFIC